MALDALPSLEHIIDHVPDGNEQITRGKFELFEEVEKADGILRVCRRYSSLA